MEQAQEVFVAIFYKARVCYNTVQKLDKGRGFMSIVVNLSPELEALLYDRAARQGQEVGLMVSELLASVLAWEEQDSESVIHKIQQGLDDFESGRFRSFESFAEEQRRKYEV